MKILLISMPFGPHYSPSLGLSILKSVLAGKNNISCKVKYYNLKFAEIIGTDFYSKISLGTPMNQDMLGEWIFSDSLFHNQTEAKVEEYFQNVIKGNLKEHEKNFVRRNNEILDLGKIKIVRRKVEGFLEDCLSEIKSEQPDLVGFTSVFQQQLASLSLAKRIKEWNKNIFIVFGGANNEGEMGKEVIRKFDFVDAVISGEGEKAFSLLADRLISKEDINSIKGVITQENVAVLNNPGAEMISDMDSIPTPDYEDYFKSLENYQFEHPLKPRLLFETSRGCWWGEVSHCTFCGLNGVSMKFRSKTADHAMEEIKSLTKKYPHIPISVVDNILDMEYFKSFIPLLIEEKLDLELFYEVKANLRKEQLLLLREAGITIIQPGIESLSDEVLKLMGKGVKAIQNIQLLKWCKELGINAEWNMIWGFPEESEEDYQKMADLIPTLVHLHPPYSASQIRLDRFSPNFNDYKGHGFRKIYPYPSYKYIYPFDDKSVANLAYYFAYEYDGKKNCDYVAGFKKQISEWQNLYEESDLFYIVKGELVLIWDFRPIAEDNLLVLRGLEGKVFLALDKMKTLPELQELLCKDSDQNVTLEDIQRITDKFIKKSLIFHNEVHFISLAIELGDYQPNVKILKKLNDYLNRPGFAREEENTVIDLGKV